VGPRFIMLIEIRELPCERTSSDRSGSLLGLLPIRWSYAHELCAATLAAASPTTLFDVDVPTRATVSKDSTQNLRDHQPKLL